MCNVTQAHPHSFQSGVVNITDKHILQYRKKQRDEKKEQYQAQHTALRHSCHYVVQFTPTTIHWVAQWATSVVLLQIVDNWPHKRW